MRLTGITVGEDLKPISGKTIRSERRFVDLADYLTGEDLKEAAELIFARLKIENLTSITLQIGCSITRGWIEDDKQKEG